ncbi:MULTISPECIES: MBL fold metallo-hydrolase [Halobacterium]|uniref:MBL fold metallo-hydrolase n=1 Tax=Halobacterium TaxID=2239 RepID=UPI001E2973FA|nr:MULTISPECIES: MBL fold metallo-hydrolase [Halobacterium]MCG1003248.1 MBL fold metallo-hydrolase [Halobacterium noricense]
MITEPAPDVYDVTLAESNGGRYRVFVFDGDVPTLVDAGLEGMTETVADALADLGIEPERLVVTHGDGDHVGGLHGLVDRYDLETWLPEDLDVEGHEPDHRFGDGDDVGQFTAVHTPGHAPEHHSLVDEDSGVAVIGDALFGADSRGLPEGYFVLPTGYYSENLNEADESLGKLLDFDFDVGLVYHGESVTENASEKLDSFVNFAGKPS